MKRWTRRPAPAELTARPEVGGELARESSNDATRHDRQFVSVCDARSIGCRHNAPSLSQAGPLRRTAYIL
jgi:hypothetical protein